MIRINGKMRLINAFNLIEAMLCGTGPRDGRIKILIARKNNFMMNIKSEQFAFALSSPLSLPHGTSFMLGNVTDIEVWTDFRVTIKLVLLIFN